MGNPLETIAIVQEIEGQQAERRHLEMMAATIAAGLLEAYPDLPDAKVAKYSVSSARAIQEEVRRAQEPRDA